MNQTMDAMDAIYEHGVFRVLDSDAVKLPDGQRVRLTAEPVDALQSGVDMLMHLYDGLTEEEIDEIEKAIFDRRDFFSGRPLV